MESTSAKADGGIVTWNNLCEHAITYSGAAGT
jgi:hypothetical protein